MEVKSFHLFFLMGTVACTGLPGLAGGKRRVHQAFVYSDWFVCTVCFFLYSRVSLSSCPFLDMLYCLPRTVGAPLESVLNLVSRMSPCGAYDTHHAVLRVTITCSIGYDGADASSIHRGTYHILKSTWSTTRSVFLPMALVSPPSFCQGQGKQSLIPYQRTLF